ncbi:LysR family transcriptional regulator [Sneathiella limimaris]|uniref:LysR family transcriptional regulator n=1 Tax=Sneathiella limimaris TaxID=1964213 RepID=UPI00146BFF99|nr:LysR family transcriptional regulator [Sneathiella limimaris]
MTKAPKISLTQWTLFNAVMEEGGYLKAAKKLNRSHSSLHHAVAKLQDQLGVELLKVEGKQPVLTEIGEVVLRRTKQLVQEAQDIETLAAQLNKGWESEITLAVENIFPKSRLHPILKAFSGDNRISRLRILDVVLMGAAETIQNRSADLVISPILPSGYVGTPLLSIELFPFAHKDHPLNTQDNPATQKELAASLQIVIKDTASQETDSRFGWLKSEKRWTVSDFYHAREILKTGEGFCWAPAHILEPDVSNGLLKPIATAEELSRIVPLYLVEPKAETAGPGVQLLAKLIREKAAENATSPHH